MRTRQLLQRLPEAESKPHTLLKTKAPDTGSDFDSSPHNQPVTLSAGGSRVSRQTAVRQLQQTQGNAAVRRLLATQDRVQRDDTNGLKTFDCPIYAGDTKLEAVLNDRDRLKIGDSGESVRKVQQGLIDDGVSLPQFGVDSKYGGETATAVKEFKAKHNLGSTQFGDVGPGTMGELDRLCGGSGPQPKPPTDDKTCPADTSNMGNDPATITGLHEGDGASSATAAQKPRVHRLQELLVRKTGAGLDLNCQFDAPTKRVLSDFQTGLAQQGVAITQIGTVDVPTANDLLGNQGPTPVNPKDDAQLEDTLDDVSLQHQLLFRTQDAGLTRLETDLSTNPDKQSNLGVDILKLIVKTALGAMVGGAGSFLGDQITTALTKANMSADDQKLVNEKGVKSIFDAAQKAVEDGSESKVEAAMIKDDKSIDAFIDAQRSVLIDVSGSAQEAFLTQTKAALRQPATPKPGAPQTNEDPRVTRAKKYVEAVRSQRTGAFEQQYSESAEKYAVGEAQSTLKTTPDDKQGGREGTDLSKDTLGNTDIGALKGVVRVDLKLDEPNKPVKVDSAEVGGLSDKTRKRLLTLHPTLLGLGLPIIAEGAKGGFIGIGRTKIKIGRNENLTVFESGSNDKGIAYLKAKALNAANELPPDSPLPVDAVEGARKVFDEIDGQTLKELKAP